MGADFKRGRKWCRRKAEKWRQKAEDGPKIAAYCGRRQDVLAFYCKRQLKNAK